MTVEGSEGEEQDGQLSENFRQVQRRVESCQCGWRCDHRETEDKGLGKWQDIHSAGLVQDSEGFVQQRPGSLGKILSR